MEQGDHVKGTIISSGKRIERGDAGDHELMDLEERVKTLRETLAGEREYGSGDAHEQALRYFYDKMIVLLIENFQKKSELVRTELAPVHIQISMLGFSPETAVLAFHALRPQRLVVLYANKAIESCDVVRRFVVGDTDDRISDSCFVALECPPADPEKIIAIIGAVVASARQEIKDAQVVVDITGGKKVMSAAAALAASKYELPVVYIDGNYDPSLRRPIPGSEELLVVSKGRRLRTNIEWLIGAALYRAGQFGLAAQRFRLIATYTGTESARLWQAISECLDAWSSVDTYLFRKKQATLANILDSPIALTLDGDQCRSLEGLLRLAQALNSNTGNLYYPHIVRSVAEYKESLGEFGLSSLMYYRTIEMCFQIRLSFLVPGLDSSIPNYSLFPIPEDELLARTIKAASRIDSFAFPSVLPSTVGLMNSVLLLMAIEDSMIDEARLAEFGELQSLHKAVDLRNDSVLAHGSKALSALDCSQLRKWADRILSAYTVAMARSTKWCLVECPMQVVPSLSDPSVNEHECHG